MQRSTVANSQLNTPWWLELIAGIAAVIAGFLLLTSPVTTLFVIIQVMGFYWFFRGIFDLISLVWDRRLWGWKVLAGVLGIMAGVAIVQHPLYAAILVPTVLIVVLGIQGIAIGIAELVIAFRGGGLGAIILGVLSIVFGVVLIANPLVGVIALPWIMGIAGLVGGIGAIIGAFRNR